MNSKKNQQSIHKHAFTVAAAVFTVAGVIGSIHAQAEVGGTSSINLKTINKNKAERKSLSASLFTPGDGMTEISVTPLFASTKLDSNVGFGNKEIKADTKILDLQVQHGITDTDVSIRAGTSYGTTNVNTPGFETVTKDGTGNFNLGAAYRLPTTDGNVFFSLNADISPGSVDSEDKHFYTGTDTYTPAVSYETMTSGGVIWGGEFGIGFPTVKLGSTSEAGNDFYNLAAFAEVPVSEFSLGVRGDYRTFESDKGRISLNTRAEKATLTAYAEFIVDSNIRFIPRLQLDTIHPGGLSNSENVTNGTAVSVLMGMTL